MHRRNLLVFAVLGAAALAGCSDNSQTTTSADTLDKDVLTVGMELAYPPFEGKDAAGNPAGVSPDFMADFGKA